jgi:hypothetical protein
MGNDEGLPCGKRLKVAVFPGLECEIPKNRLMHALVIWCCILRDWKTNFRRSDESVGQGLVIMNTDDAGPRESFSHESRFAQAVVGVVGLMLILVRRTGPRLHVDRLEGTAYARVARPEIPMPSVLCTRPMAKEEIGAVFNPHCARMAATTRHRSSLEAGHRPSSRDSARLCHWRPPDLASKPKGPHQLSHWSWTSVPSIPDGSLLAPNAVRDIGGRSPWNGWHR